jgi:oligopeptide transport system substrate-binding protein
VSLDRRALLARLAALAAVAGVGGAASAGQAGSGSRPGAGAGTALPASSVASGHLRRAGVDDPASLDPTRMSFPSEVSVVGDLFVGLLTLDAAAQPIAGCAESWSTSDDGLTWTFRLRPGLQWSDGAPLGSADFVYAFRRMLDPATAFTFAPRLYPIRGARDVNAGRTAPDALGVSASGERTVTIALEHPAAYLPEVLATYSSPAPRATIEKHGADWARPGRVVCNGPFTLAEWVPNSHVRLLRNPRFYDAARVRLAEVTHFTVDSAAAAVNRFRAGDLDVVLVVPPDRLDWARENLRSQLQLFPGFGIEHVVLNVRRAPFDDPRVRRAVALAADREALAAKVLRSGETAAYGIVPPRASNYPVPMLADFATWPQARRVAEARRLLAEAGYGAARPLRFTLSYGSGDVPRRVAVALAATWKAAGIQAELAPAEAKAALAAAQRGEFQAFRFQWLGGTTDPASFLERFTSAARGVNLSGYSNPAYDALYARAERTRDLDARAELLRQVEALALRDLPVVPLYWYAGRRLVASRVSGWTNNVRGVHLSRWLAVR